MGKIGAGLGTFEMMGKTASFAPLYNSMASIASSLARAKAEAAKQQKKAEEAAQAKIDDFIISDKNQYTQKYLPFAQKAFAELVTNIQEDKVKYPNIWMNRVSTRILQAKDKLNWAVEQSNFQRDIEKKAEEGFMVPGELLQAYKQNPGNIEDIQKLSPALSLYGISVAQDGAISHSLSKPLEIGDDYAKFKSTRAIFGAPTTTITAKKSTDGSQYDEVRTEKTIDTASFENYKVEAAKNKDIRATFKVRRLNEVSAEFDALRKDPALSQYGDAELFEMATTIAIQNTVDSMPKSDITTSVSRQPSGKGITVNVGGEKYVQPVEANFTANMVTGYDKNSRSIVPTGDVSDKLSKKIQEGGGSYVFKNPSDDKTYVYKKEGEKVVRYPATISDVPAFNAQLAHSRRGTDPDKISQFQDLETEKLFLPSTMERIPASDVSKIFKEGTIIDYYYMDGKVYAKMNIELKTSAANVPPSLSGVTTFIVEVPRGRKLDGVGATLATTVGGEKYSSMYDYFKDMAPSSGQSTGGQQTQTGTSAGAPTYTSGSLNP
jgi:hypothetical protein